MKASQLAKLVHGQLHGVDVSFQDFSIDSRTIQSGNMFIALKGENFDGHDFVAKAKDNGAVLAMVERFQDIDLPQIIVSDTYAGMSLFAAQHRLEMQDIKIVAMTGSCGKTTTKQMIASILSQNGPTLAAQGSFNNHIGVPLTLLGLKPEHRFAVIEMGANHPHEILPLTQMAKPDVAIITIIAPVHTEGFGDVDTIAKTKAEIFRGLPADGVAVINADDSYHDFFATQLGHKKVLHFSMTGKAADVFATHIVLNEGCPAFLLHTPKGNVEIQLPILGKHNVTNALAAASAAIALGIPLAQIAKGLLTMQSAKHRLHVCKGFHDAKIIDDAYNANPLAVKAALDILASYPGEKVWVFSDMRELGSFAKDAHEEVGLFAKEKGIARIFAIGEFSPITVAAFGEGAQHFPDKLSLIAALKPLMHKDMTILVKGSRGGRLEEVVDALTPKE